MDMTCTFKGYLHPKALPNKRYFLTSNILASSVYTFKCPTSLRTLAWEMFLIGLPLDVTSLKAMVRLGNAFAMDGYSAQIFANVVELLSKSVPQPHLDS